MDSDRYSILLLFLVLLLLWTFGGLLEITIPTAILVPYFSTGICTTAAEDGAHMMEVSVSQTLIYCIEAQQAVDKSGLSEQE